MPSNIDKLPAELSLLFTNYKNTPIARNIARNFGFIIPDDVTTSEKLLQWVNELPELPIKQTNTSRPQSRPQQPAEEYVTFDVDMTGREYGRLYYSIRVNSSVGVRVTRREMQEALENNDYDVDAAKSDLMNVITDRAENNADWDSGDSDYDYSDYEAEGMEDTETDNYDDVESALEDELQNMLPEEEEDE